MSAVEWLLSMAMLMVGIKVVVAATGPLGVGLQLARRKRTRSTGAALVTVGALELAGGALLVLVGIAIGGGSA